MKQISIREQDEFIKLGQALKRPNLVSSGVEAKNCYSGRSGDCKR